MATWSLSAIQQKIRNVTGRFTPAEISNEELTDRINQFYQLTFPAEVKLDTKETYYTFITEANQSWYDVPLTTYTNFLSPATINNLSMIWYQNPPRFYADNWQQYNFTNPWTGDGSTTTFTTSITGFPILPSTLTISDGVELFEDTSQTYTTSNVNITGSQGGSATINYSTGAVSVTFNTAPLNGALIHLNYVLFSPRRPTALLYYNNQFQLWPVPDQQYLIRMGAYSVVSPLVNATDTPELNEWGPCIAYGTARNILADYGELDGYAEVTILYKEQVSYILRRTEQNMFNVRAAPQF